MTKTTNKWKATISALFVIATLIAVGLGCSGPSDAKPVTADYHGVWKADDGSIITIRSDGSADYKSGGTTVTGGKAELSDGDKMLNITMFGMGPDLKIDKAPDGSQMTLDGIIYKKSS